MKGRVLVVGSLNMDLIVNAPRLPQVGETILGGRFTSAAGGKGANQAVAAARMGARVGMIGCVGRDDFGRELLRVASQDQIDISHIVVHESEATGIALIAVDGQGRNTIIVASGANLALTPREVRAARSLFAAADMLITQLESPLETVQEAISLAVEHHIQVILNPAPARPLSRDLLSKVDYLIPNEREAMQISETDHLESATNKLLTLGVHNLIVTLGEQGVLIATKDSRIQIPAYSVDAIDTVAAGDAFVGAFAASLAQGMHMEAAARIGNAAAAISVTRRGAQPSLPTRKEVDEFIVHM